MATRGLVLLAKDTFTTVSSVSFDNVFSATYKQYRIITNISSASAGYSYMRLRASGTDNSSANYFRQFYAANGGTGSAARSSSQTTWAGITEMNTYSNIQIIEVNNPFQSTYTSAINLSNDTSAGNIVWFSNVFGMNVTTSYDGFTIKPDSSTISGTITVYGLAQ
jgi:hypothetical protein